MPRPPNPSRPPPRSASDEWAAQQLQAEREARAMRRVIGGAVLLGLLLWALIEHWIVWPF